MVAIDDGATALPLGIKAGEEGCLALPFESDKRRGEAGVEEYDGNQLTAADTDENGNDEGEESSEAAPLKQDWGLKAKLLNLHGCSLITLCGNL